MNITELETFHEASLWPVFGAQLRKMTNKQISTEIKMEVDVGREIMVKWVIP